MTDFGLIQTSSVFLLSYNPVKCALRHFPRSRVPSAKCFAIVGYNIINRFNINNRVLASECECHENTAKAE